MLNQTGHVDFETIYEELQEEIIELIVSKIAKYSKEIDDEISIREYLVARLGQELKE